MKKIIRKDLILESCGQKDHKKGCYIRLKEEKSVCHSKPYSSVILDYDSKGELVGIEFYDGLNFHYKKG